MKLIVGLGNPGKPYENTRHNIGFMALDQILAHENISCNQEKFGGKYGEKSINGEKYMFLKPQLFINLSGEIIAKYVHYYKLSVDDILIIHDDLDLAVGCFKLKPQGSSAGHNGLKNIELHLQTKVYPRLKIGISNNKNIDTKDYVLGKLSKEDLEKLNPILEMMPQLFLDYTKMNFNDLMNKYNHHTKE